MSAQFRLSAAVVALIAFAPVPAALAQDGPPPASCGADMAANDARFKATIQRLESVKNGTQAQKCAAYRSHVQIMKQAVPVFRNCTRGLAQRENVGQMNDSIGDFEQLIKTKC